MHGHFLPCGILENIKHILSQDETEVATDIFFCIVRHIQVKRIKEEIKVRTCFHQSKVRSESELAVGCKKGQG